MTYEHGDHCLHRFPQCPRCYSELATGARARQMYLERLIEDSDSLKPLKRWAESHRVALEDLPETLERASSAQGRVSELTAENQYLQGEVERLGSLLHDAIRQQGGPRRR